MLLITCKVQVTSPDGSTHQARALLDPAWSVSTMKRLAQQLRYHKPKVSDIGGAGHSSHGTVHFEVSPAYCGGKSFPVEAEVFSEVTTNIPSHSMPFHWKSKHPMGLSPSDLDFWSSQECRNHLGSQHFSHKVLQDPLLRPPIGHQHPFQLSFVSNGKHGKITSYIFCKN